MVTFLFPSNPARTPGPIDPLRESVTRPGGSGPRCQPSVASAHWHSRPLLRSAAPPRPPAWPEDLMPTAANLKALCEASGHWIGEITAI